MTLDKSIEILVGLDKTYAPVLLPDRKKALKLGIEALKRIQLESPYAHAYPRKLLPGETEENIPRTIGKLPGNED